VQLILYLCSDVDVRGKTRLQIAGGANHSSVLHVGFASNGDLVPVGSQHGTVPYLGPIMKRYKAGACQQRRKRRSKTRLTETSL
jgi:hypothetical protein